MRPFYIGLAVVVILIVAGFAISNVVQNKSRADTLAFESSTPTPAPTPTVKPIPIVPGKAIGKSAGFTQGDITHGKAEDTPQGGLGQDVDGIPCQTQEGVVLHIHTELTLFVHGAQVQIPAFIGMAPNAEGGCLYWIHTHDASGVIHVEAGNTSSPNGGPYTLGMFFDIWGQPLSGNQIGPFKGPVTAFVNGQRYTGDLHAIPLRAHQLVTLEVGTPVVPPPNYAFPVGD